MPKQGRIADHADEIAMMSNLPYREIARKLNEKHGTKFTHTGVMRHVKKQSMPLATVTVKADVARQVTMDFMRGEWFRAFTAAWDGLARAIVAEDLMAESRFLAQIRGFMEMPFKIGDRTVTIIQPPVAEVIKEVKGEELRAWAKRILSS